MQSTRLNELYYKGAVLQWVSLCQHSMSGDVPSHPDVAQRNARMLASMLDYVKELEGRFDDTSRIPFGRLRAFMGYLYTHRPDTEPPRLFPHDGIVHLEWDRAMIFMSDTSARFLPMDSSMTFRLQPWGPEDDATIAPRVAEALF